MKEVGGNGGEKEEKGGEKDEEREKCNHSLDDRGGDGLRNIGLVSAAVEDFIPLSRRESFRLCMIITSSSYMCHHFRKWSSFLMILVCRCVSKLMYIMFKNLARTAKKTTLHY
jgi:hypothetical protein